jgi:hypothetical protein
MRFGLFGEVQPRSSAGTSWIVWWVVRAGLDAVAKREIAVTAKLLGCYCLYSTKICDGIMIVTYLKIGWLVRNVKMGKPNIQRGEFISILLVMFSSMQSAC